MYLAGWRLLFLSNAEDIHFLTTTKGLLNKESAFDVTVPPRLYNTLVSLGTCQD